MVVEAVWGRRDAVGTSLDEEVKGMDREAAPLAIRVEELAIANMLSLFSSKRLVFGRMLRG